MALANASGVDAPLILQNNNYHAGRVARLWRSILDFDKDGFSPFLGGGDCNDLSDRVHPLAFDLPENGIDEDCDGVDLSIKEIARVKRFWQEKRWLSKPNLSQKLHNKNILLITVDALRADHLSKQSTHSLSHLSAFLAESFDFSYAFAAASSTRLSLPILHTSRLIPSHSPSSSTLAQKLLGLGYRTHHVGQALPISFTAAQRLEFHPPFDLRRGFASLDLVEPLTHGDGVTRGHRDREVINRLIPWLAQRAAKKKFFAWVHLFDLHGWKDAKYPRAQNARTRYALAAAKSLSLVDDLLSNLKRLGLYRQTIVLLSADHGEALGERGIWHHTRYVYDFLVRVPLFLRLPGTVGR
ncbi:MAG: sulfatase-like hydrolase/transferase, partial [Deltaproteobacteria bacterium]|nr:sulfatase-like hydrolase/transferase [Deltaproteobacteria bacterium]